MILECLPGGRLLSAVASNIHARIAVAGADLLQISGPALAPPAQAMVSVREPSGNRQVRSARAWWRLLIVRCLGFYLRRAPSHAGRWRLVIPWPQYESNLDLIELVPA